MRNVQDFVSTHFLLPCAGCALLALASTANAATPLQVQLEQQGDGDLADAQALCTLRGEHLRWGANSNPAVSWQGAPAATQSYALLLEDLDALRHPQHANDARYEIAPGAARESFAHWVLADIPATVQALPAALESGVRDRGKALAAALPGRSGLNDYSYYFNDYPSFASVLQEQLGDAGSTLGGLYSGYDGPCPAWNDARPHRYRLSVYALDVAQLALPAAFDARALRQALRGHVLAQGHASAAFSLNPDLR